MKRTLVVLSGLVLAAVFANAALAAPTPVTIGQTSAGAAPCVPSAWAIQNPGASYVVPPGNWTLTSWSTQAGPSPAGSMSLMVFRPTTTPGSYLVVGESPVETLAAGSLDTFTLASPVNVQGGDLLGLWENSAYCAILGGSNGVVGNFAATEPPVGATVTTPDSQASTELNISATLVPQGYIEVCKQSSGTPAATGNFQFTVTDAAATSQTVTVAAGLCSGPIAVAAGPATVVENGSLSALDATGAVSSSPSTSYITATANAVGPSGATGTFDGKFTLGSISVPQSSPSTGTLSTVRVTYTDSINQGYLEVCKTIVSGSGLTGSWTFSVTGGNGETATETVAEGSCSDPFLMPIGFVKVQETGDLAENVTAITATRNNGTVNAVDSVNLSTQTVVTDVVAPPLPGDTGQETLVTFQNGSVSLKLCKWVSGSPTPSTGPYTFSWTASGPVGPPAAGGASGTASIPAGTSQPGNCVVAGTFRAGTVVTITEAVAPGTKVGYISVNGSSSPTAPAIYTGGSPFAGAVVAGSESLPNRTIQVVLGPGETVVAYDDIPALPGALKICKAEGTEPAGSTIPAGTLFPFTVANASGPSQPIATTVMVPLGGCNTVPGSFPFNSAQAIVEGPVTGTVLTGVTTDPANVEVLEGGVVTQTNQASLQSSSLTTKTAVVLIGENNTTNVTFTNIDPPATSSPGDGGTSGSSGGGTPVSSSGGGSPVTPSGGGTTVSSSGGGSPVSSSGGGGSSSTGTGTGSGSSTPAVVAAVAGVGAALTPPPVTLPLTTKSTATSAQLAKALKLSKFRTELKALKLSAHKLSLKLALTKKHSAKHKTLAKQITNLKAREVKISTEIELLVK